MVVCRLGKMVLGICLHLGDNGIIRREGDLFRRYRLRLIAVRPFPEYLVCIYSYCSPAMLGYLTG